MLLFAACGSPPAGEDASIDAGTADAAAPDGSRGCASDLECGDGRFCNGVERCLAADGGAGACVAGEPPCATGECDEETASCVDPCASPDADGDGSPSIACGGEDCDDSDASRFPGNLEVCDARHVDEDCDGMVDEDCDCVDEQTMPCDTDRAGTGVCVAGTQRCIAGVWGACEGSVLPSEESCNGADDDCDGDTDERVQQIFYRDEDDDGFGDPAAAIAACTAPAGYVANRMDGCPSNASLQAPRLLHRDIDGDGYGNEAVGYLTCNPVGSGWLEQGGDCCDFDNRARPGQTEWFSSANECGTFDYNCNGMEDRRWTEASSTPGCGVNGFECNPARFDTWKGTVAPCGETRQMYRRYGPGGCNNEFGHICDQMEESRQQTCR